MRWHLRCLLIPIYLSGATLSRIRGLLGSINADTYVPHVFAYLLCRATSCYIIYFKIHGRVLLNTKTSDRQNLSNVHDSLFINYYYWFLY